MRKPTICICENKDADQLRGNREADQRLCFRYTDSTIPLISKCEISSFQPFSVAVQAGWCQTCSETTLLVFPRGGSTETPMTEIGRKNQLREDLASFCYFIHYALTLFRSPNFSYSARCSSHVSI